MINKISFSSYKKFAGHEEMEIRPVTLLVGKNSSGKSSIIKLISMLADAFSSDKKTTGISIPEAYTELSHNGYSQGLKIGATFSDLTQIFTDLLPGEKRGAVVDKYTLVTSKGNRYDLVRKPSGDIYSCEQLDVEYQKDDLSGFVCNSLFQVGGVDAQVLKQVVDHVGPLRAMPDSTIDIGEDTDFVGIQGKGAYQMLYSHDDLAEKVSNWFNEAFNGCQMSVEPSREDSTKFRIMFRKPYMGDFSSNIVNEGMGISQVLPIVTRCLHPVEGSIVVVEQPELHLHPAAHASLSYLFAKTAKHNNQRYVIETHSLNILLGLRAAVVDPGIDIAPKDIIIYFVDEDEEGSYLRSITIDDKGNLSDWPTGVFNESFELMLSIKEKAQE